MFGYVRPFKPYMRMCEYDTYRGVYCGLCKTIGREFGFVPRLMLSYDFTFLALIDLSLNNVKLSGERQRCIAHPLKKTFCVGCKTGLEYSAYAAQLLIYHKLKDDLQDREFKSKLRSVLLLPLFKRHYKKARLKYGSLADMIEQQMVRQHEIENDKCDAIDIACEPTAKIMEAMFGELDSCDANKDLKRFGYLVGRYIYLCDALDDVRKDKKKGNYNPLLVMLDSTGGSGELKDDEYEKIKSFIKDNVNFTLGELAEVYDRMQMQMYKPIIDNIIYIGLKNVYELIEQGKFNNKQEGKMTNE